MTYSTAIDTQFSSGTNLTLCPEPKELFVRIKDGVANEIIREGLTRTQSKLYFYFSQLDRFGDRFAKFDLASTLAATGIGKTAYYNAIAFFKNKGWFDFTDGESQVSNNTTVTKKSANANSDSANANSDSANANPNSANANSDSVKTNSNSAKTEFKKLKAVPYKRSTTPQTLQTSSNFNKTNKTLSEAKRERNEFLWKNTFDEADRRQLSYFAYQVAIPKLPTKPTLPDAWIVCNCEELFNQMMYDVEFQKKWEKFSANSPTVKFKENTSKLEPRDTMDW
ncbi:hypothetical protein [Microcoleus sp. Pol7_B1]|uniref:hypothetical protein n=1 Tax=Microcoleus sp. Pol7_B1 TaxID=2818894 RepID=UPI002FD783C7